MVVTVAPLLNVEPAVEVERPLRTPPFRLVNRLHRVDLPTCLPHDPSPHRSTMK